MYGLSTGGMSGRSRLSGTGQCIKDGVVPTHAKDTWSLRQRIETVLCLLRTFSSSGDATTYISY